MTTSSGPADQTPRPGQDNVASPPIVTPADADELDPSGESSEPEVITHPQFRIWLRADGIVQMVSTPGESMDFDGAIAAREATAALTGGRKYPILVDGRGGASPDRRARGEFARPSDLMSAAALLVDTPLTRMMGNFLLTVSKPVTPTSLFENEGAAVAWLKEFLP